MNPADYLPWSYWAARSKKIWGDAEPLCCWGTHDEALLYIRSVFDEARTRAVATLRAEAPRPENVAAKRYAHREPHVEYDWRFVSPYDTWKQRDWLQTEKLLKGRNALKYSVVDLKRRSAKNSGPRDPTQYDLCFPSKT